MPKPSSKAILQQLAKRDVKQFRLDDYLFREQLEFVRDPAYFKIAVTSRRAGKSVSCAADLIDTLQAYPDTTSLYITLSRNNAKKIIWPELKRIDRKFKIGLSFNESELSAEHPNGSVLYLSGASDRTEIEKFRGLALKKVYIDEGQSFPAYIQDLIDDVLSPALLDYNGTLAIIGTPSAVPSGFFFDASRSEGWSHHFWTFFNNPHVSTKSGQTHEEMLQRVLKQRGVTIDDPSIRREYFGEWALDSNSLVYKYDRNVNDYDKVPENKTVNYILGVDIGFDDADAIALLAYNSHDKETYLVEETIANKQGITELVKQINVYLDNYTISKIVMDQGGLGKKIAEEITRRHNIPVTAAEKHRKMEFIELMNDSLRTGRLKAKANSRFAQDCFKVEWDLDKCTPDRKVMKKKKDSHSDICDAVLYAWRESMSYMSAKPVPKPKLGSPKWVEDLEEQAMEYFKKQEEADKFWNGK